MYLGLELDVQKESTKSGGETTCQDRILWWPVHSGGPTRRWRAVASIADSGGLPGISCISFLIEAPSVENPVIESNIPISLMLHLLKLCVECSG